MGKNGKGNKQLPPPLGRPVNRGCSLSQGLVMACPFNENGGLITKDVAGNLNGTNSVALVRTARGFSTLFTTGKVTFPVGFPKNIGATNTDPFTVSLWLNRANTNSSHLFGWAAAGSGAGWYCNLNAVGTGLLNFDYYDGTRYIRTNTSLVFGIGTWYHVVFTRDNTNAIFPANTQKIYINGVDAGTTQNAGVGTPNSVSLSTLTFAIASRGTSGTICGGYINNFMMWNRVLTLGEIRTLYAQPYMIYK